jgi:hypothetical protein
MSYSQELLAASEPWMQNNKDSAKIPNLAENVQRAAIILDTLSTEKSTYTYRFFNGGQIDIILENGFDRFEIGPGKRIVRILPQGIIDLTDVSLTELPDRLKTF